MDRKNAFDAARRHRKQRQHQMSGLGYNLAVVWACAVKDIQSALTERVFTIVSLLLPLNFLLLFLLFVLTGGQAPIAVVMADHGPYARQFLTALERAHSFIITPAGGTSAAHARELIESGQIVGVITIPATFDADLRAGRPIALPVTINNLDVDFTNDIRRAVPLTITRFYAEAFPNQVVVQAHEVDVQARDTGYVPYLAVSILVLGLMIGGLFQAGSSAAREYETGTVKELLLSPASRWAIEAGKVLGAAIMNLASAGLVLAVIVLLLGVWPAHWGEVIGYSLLLIVIFVALGTLLGTLARRRQVVIPLAAGLALPIFFLSGAFGPVEWGTPAIQVLARVFPTYYGIAALQHAFHGYATTPISPVLNTLILVGFAALAVAVSALALRRTTASH